VTAPQPPPSQQPNAAPDKALADAIVAEHATIYGYGLVSAHSFPEENDLVSDSLDEHRGRREAAIAILASRSVAAPVAAVGYRLPMSVKNNIDAATLAVTMEDDDAVAWRAAREQATSPQDRTFAVTALAQCAVRAARWRQVLNKWPLTVPFPGGSEQPSS
jgi:hypothetical protein